MSIRRNVTILFTTAIFPVLVSIALALFILSGLLLSQALVSSVSWLTPAHFQTCQAALRPVACVLKATTPR